MLLKKQKKTQGSTLWWRDRDREETKDREPRGSSLNDKADDKKKSK
jgi:hypothetical protein